MNNNITVNDLKAALRMLPMVRGLYDKGIIDISPSPGMLEYEYLQLRESAFLELFPDIEPVDGRYSTVVDGVEIMSLTRARVDSAV